MRYVIALFILLLLLDGLEVKIEVQSVKYLTIGLITLVVLFTGYKICCKYLDVQLERAKQISIDQPK